MTAQTHCAPGLRRLPPPTIDPPFDDELGLVRTPPRRARLPKPESATPAQGTLMLALDGGPKTRRRSAAPESATLPSNSPRSRGVVRPMPSAGTALPNPRRWAARVAQALVEILYGKRPVQQLLHWTSRAVYHQLASKAATNARAAPTAAPYVRSVRVCEVNSEVVEACAVLHAGDHVRALAFRLETGDTRWICTAFDLV